MLLRSAVQSPVASGSLDHIGQHMYCKLLSAFGSQPVAASLCRSNLLPVPLRIMGRSSASASAAKAAKSPKPVKKDGAVAKSKGSPHSKAAKAKAKCQKNQERMEREQEAKQKEPLVLRALELAAKKHQLEQSDNGASSASSSALVPVPAAAPAAAPAAPSTPVANQAPASAESPLPQPVVMPPTARLSLPDRFVTSKTRAIDLRLPENAVMYPPLNHELPLGFQIPPSPEKIPSFAAPGVEKGFEHCNPYAEKIAALEWEVPRGWTPPPPSEIERPVVYGVPGMMKWANHGLGIVQRVLPSGAMHFLKHTLGGRTYRTMFSGIDAPGAMGFGFSWAEVKYQSNPK